MPAGEPLSRRRFLRAAGGLAGGAALGGVLATRLGSSYEARPVVHMANGPAAVDASPARDGRLLYPSLQGFTHETGVLVDYREVVHDAAGFFTQIQPYLATARPTGWDVIVVPNGPVLSTLRRRGYVLDIPADRRPNFDANAHDAAADPTYDPGSRATMAWRSAITGLAYNPSLTGRRVTALADLFSEEFAGRVALSGDPLDAANLAMLAAGIAPEASTPADWDRAAGMLREQRRSGVAMGRGASAGVRALRDGGVAVAMARSDDIYRANAAGGVDLAFVMPDEGGLLRTEAMCIPAHAANRMDAIRFMDHVYRPDVAAEIAGSLASIPPVRGVRERLLGIAASTSDPVEAARVMAAASSPLLFPSDADIARLATYREFENDDEIARWDAAFGELLGAIALPSS